MITTTGLVTLAFGSSFVPWLSQLESFMTKEGYQIHTAMYEGSD